jgi:hypothetical protein
MKKGEEMRMRGERDMENGNERGSERNRGVSEKGSKRHIWREW